MKIDLQCEVIGDKTEIFVVLPSLGKWSLFTINNEAFKRSQRVSMMEMNVSSTAPSHTGVYVAFNGEQYPSA